MTMELQSNWNVPPHELIVADDDHDMDGRSVIIISSLYTCSWRDLDLYYNSIISLR